MNEQQPPELDFGISQKPEEAVSERKEILKINPADCIIFFGRGIEKVAVRGPQAEGGRAEKWKPARYIQELVKDPATGRHTRTGRRKAGGPLADFSDEDEVKEMVAGGTANAIAAVELYEQLCERGVPPKEIIVSGGRPSYLERESGSPPEARVLYEYFVNKISADKKAKAPVPENISVLETSRSTEDDVRETLQLALGRGYKRVVIVNADVAIERTKAFYEHTVLAQNPELAQLEVEFIKANDLLRLRMGPRYEKIEAALRATKAFEDTVKNEEIGRQKVIKGEYGKGGRGKGNY